MLKVITSESPNTPTTIDFAGDLRDVVSDLGEVVRTIYGTLRSMNVQEAEYFKTLVITVFSDPRTPVWKPIHGIHDCATIGGPNENN